MTLRPISNGTQSFENLRRNGFLYVDKTEYVFRLANSATQNVFLARPRRFGKSLLISTLKCYFEARRELFEGLAIDKLETEWTKYPVLHFDLSKAKYLDQETLLSSLSMQLSEYESVYCNGKSSGSISDRLNTLIRNANLVTGQKVVVLVDEYDAPLLDVLTDNEKLSDLRNIMRNFYSPLKACNEYLRFVFLAGITKFSQMSIFSELNNLQNISMLCDYDAICGITENEMLTQLTEYIDALAQVGNLTRDETVAKLKIMYDGYHFCFPSPDIYNPYSLLNALSTKKIEPFWFSSGTPTFLVEMLQKHNVLPQQIGGRECFVQTFDAPTERLTEITPLLYQSGYLTIKNYDPEVYLYLLDIPNNEVRIGLFDVLLKNYIGDTLWAQSPIAKFYRTLLRNDMQGMLEFMQQFLLTIPQCDNTDYEGHYQSMFYLMFSLFGIYMQVEVRTATGRIDIVMHAQNTVYIIELKLGDTAESAIRQINEKNYAATYATGNKQIVKVGVSFNYKTRTIDDWIIEN